jgi:hypothetical protein
MTRTRLSVAGIAATLAFSAAAASAASAALPELGQCEKVAPGSGEYAAASCTGGVIANGTYDWHPGASKPSFVSGGGASTLETTAGVKIACKAVADEGSYSGPQIVATLIKFLGCEDVGIGGPCENTSAGGEIVVFMVGEWGFIKNFVKEGKLILSVGLDLAPPEHTTFRCQGPRGNAEFALFGSVIATVTPIDKMSAKFTLKYTQSKGKQKPAKFQGGPKDTPFLENLITKTVEEAGLASTDTLSNAQPLEIKAKV